MATAPVDAAADLPTGWRLLPCGERAVLLELPDPTTRRRVDSLLRRRPLAGALEHVPAACTVLVTVNDPRELRPVVGRLRRLALEVAALADGPSSGSGRDSDDSEAGGPELEVPVVYDGEDLDDVARHLGCSTREVVARHTGQVWRVEFAGFAPGFGYLVGEAGDLEVPRRGSPRTRVPTGAVALAGPWTGVYPRPSPGGWQLIGRTALPMWDAERDPPALLVPGRAVRFVTAPAEVSR